MTHAQYMAQALDLAHHAAATGEVPVGALLLDPDGTTLATGWNRSIGMQDPTAHAEIVALREAARAVANHRLPGTTLYVTLEPCAMCAGALIQARVSRVIYGAADPRAGAAGSVYDILGDPRLNHVPEIIGGVLAAECAAVLKDFFIHKR